MSRGGAGGAPVRFGGIQIARNFAVQPGFVTMPLPTVEGSAAVPSVIDIFVNGTLQGSREVKPGPFSISQVPIQSGGGNVQLVVRDLLGREVVSSQTYYGSRELLRRGLSDYSYEAGFLRSGFGRSSNQYGALMGAITHRYGLTDSFTAEAHLEIGGRTQMGSIGAVALAGNLGVITGSAAISRSELGTGTQLAGGIERRTLQYSIGIRSEYATRAFTFVGAGDLNTTPKLKTEAYFDLALVGGTSVGFNYLRRDNRERSAESLAGVFANLSLGKFGSAQLYARRSVSQSRATMFGGTLSMSFGRRASALASVDVINNRLQTQYAYQTAAVPGIGGSWRSNASLGETRSIAGGYTFNAQAATLNVEAARSAGRTGVRASASGAVGLIGGALFASRRLGSSFAAVEIPGFKGVRVYADNQLIGMTDRKGILIVPAMRAFEPNKIRIEESDLPMDVQLSAFEHIVRPFARTGTVVSFTPRRERGVLMRVILEDGSPLPQSAEARIDGAETEIVSLPGGELYIPSLSGEARVTVNLESGTCSFEAKVADRDDPQPVLDGLVCRRVHVYPPPK